jgi:hypothetical protein
LPSERRGHAFGQRPRLSAFDERDGAAAEARAGETRPQRAAYSRKGDKGI